MFGFCLRLDLLFVWLFSPCWVVWVARFEIVLVLLICFGFCW